MANNVNKLIINIINQDNGASFHVVNNISHIDFEALDRGNVNDIVDFGIYSNKGSVEFLDVDYKFKNIANNGNAKLKVEICHLNGDVLKKKGTFFVDDYEEKSGKVTLSLSDRLTEWQDISVPRIFVFEEQSADYLLQRMLEKVGEHHITILADATTKQFLENAICDCPDIQEDSFWNDVTKICQLCQCRVFCNEDGVPVISNGSIKKVGAAIRAKHIIDVPEVYKRTHTKKSEFSVEINNINKRSGSILEQKALATLYNREVTVNDEGKESWSAVKNTSANNGITKSFYTIKDGIFKIEEGVTLYFNLPIKSNAYYNPLKDPYNALTVKQTLTSYNNTLANGTVNDLKEFLSATYRNLELNEGYNTNSVSGSVNIDYVYKGSTVFTPSRVVWSSEIDILGNYYEKSGVRKISNSQSSSNSYELPSNELMQVDNTVNSALDGYSEWYIDNISTKLSKGTECYVLTCILSDYYDENGNLLYDSTYEMFDKYDVVTPYIMRGASHVPLSIDDNGEPKKFQIIGIKYAFAGIIKQTLYLQEVHT